MASTSVRWETVNRITEMLKDHADLVGVGVWPVWPGDKYLGPEMIVGDAIEGETEVSSFKPARHHREDRFTITWQIMVASHKQNADAAMARLFVLVAAFQDICADSPTLNDLDGVVSADVTREREYPVSTPEGILAGAEVTISVHSYLD